MPVAGRKFHFSHFTSTLFFIARLLASENLFLGKPFKFSEMSKKLAIEKKIGNFFWQVGFWLRIGRMVIFLVHCGQPCSNKRFWFSVRCSLLKFER